jgi:hypothetical protein
MDNESEQSLRAADDFGQAIPDQAVLEADQEAEEVQKEILSGVPRPLPEHRFQSMEDLGRVIDGGKREGGNTPSCTS